MDQMSEAISVAVQEVQHNAERLGLTWTLRPGTVQPGVTAEGLYQVLLDGDIAPSTASSIVGHLPENFRVMVMAVPPSGTYVVGFIGTPGLLLNEEGISVPAMSSPASELLTTATATYVPLGGPGSVNSFSFRKMYDKSRVKLMMALTFFGNNTDTTIKFAVRLNNVDYPIGGPSSNVGVDRLSYTGWTYVANIPAGDYVIQGRWRKASGIGSAVRNFDDWQTISATEILPSSFA